MLYSIEQVSLAQQHEPMNDIIVDYYERDEKRKDSMMPEIDIDWQRMIDIERNGGIVAVGAFLDFDLVGFAIYIVSKHHHHQTVTMATCDTLAVSLNHRGQGIGKKLVRAAIELLKKRGVKLMAHGHRACYGRTPIFPQLGFVLEEYIYVKEL